MSKTILLVGNQLRHKYFASKFVESLPDTLVVEMVRESMIPDPPSDIPSHLTDLHYRHFHDRDAAEKTLRFSELGYSKFSVLPSQLNSSKIASLILEFAPTQCFVFGTDLIKSPVLDALPYHSYNLHLGLSPRYRGSATLFWPFVFLEPQYAGVTFHRLFIEADAGDILHQVTPSLSPSMGIHDVGVECVRVATRDAIMLAMSNLSDKKLKKQKSTGKLFLSSDYHPSHLQIIYDLYDNKIVEGYLNGYLSNKLPSLYKSI